MLMRNVQKWSTESSRPGKISYICNLRLQLRFQKLHLPAAQTDLCFGFFQCFRVFGHLNLYNGDLCEKKKKEL